VNILHFEKLPFRIAFDFNLWNPYSTTYRRLSEFEAIFGNFKFGGTSSEQKPRQNFIRHFHQKSGNPYDLQPVRPKAFFLDPSVNMTVALGHPKPFPYPSQ